MARLILTLLILIPLYVYTPPATYTDDACAGQRGPCIACGGCRSKVRLSKLNEAGPEAAEIMRKEHCTCADR